MVRALAPVEASSVARRGASLSGTIRRGGLPLARYPLRLLETGGARALASARTDGAGNYSITGIPAGGYRLVLGDLADAAPCELRISVSPTTTRLVHDFVLRE